MFKIKASFISCLILIVAFVSACQSPSSTNDEEDKSENLPGLNQNFSYNTEVGDYKTHVFDGIKVSDGIVVVGSYRETLGTCGEKLYLLKLDNNGNEMWVKKYDSLPRISGCYKGEIISTQDGGFLVTAIIEKEGNTDNNMDLFISKFTPTGDVQWSKELDYKNYDWYLNAFQHTNGNFILYPTSGSFNTGSSDTKVIMDQSGLIISEETNTDFTGELFRNSGVRLTNSKQILFTSYDASYEGTNIQLSDQNFNKIASAHFPDDKIKYIDESSSQDSFFAIDDNGNFLKLSATLEMEWYYAPPEGGISYHNKPAELKNGLYGLIEKGKPNEDQDKYRTIILCLFEEGGKVIARQVLNENGNYISPRKIIPLSESETVIVSRGNGVLIQSFSKTN